MQGEAVPHCPVSAASAQVVAEVGHSRGSAARCVLHRDRCVLLGTQCRESSRDNAALTQMRVAMLPSRNKVTDWARTVLVSTRLPTRCREKGGYQHECKRLMPAAHPVRGPASQGWPSPRWHRRALERTTHWPDWGWGAAEGTVCVGGETGTRVHKTVIFRRPHSTTNQQTQNSAAQQSTSTVGLCLTVQRTGPIQLCKAETIFTVTLRLCLLSSLSCQGTVEFSRCYLTQLTECSQDEKTSTSLPLNLTFRFVNIKQIHSSHQYFRSEVYVNIFF